MPQAVRVLRTAGAAFRNNIFFAGGKAGGGNVLVSVGAGSPA